MQKKAVVCVINDLTTDQRVHKTCLTLQKCGYWVVEYGRLLPESKPLVRPYFVLRKKLRLRSGPLFYIEYNIRLFFHLMTCNADLIVSNDLDTLPAAYFAAKFRKKKLIYDTHEYFTEMPELVNRKFTQFVWRGIENFFFSRLDHILTVNDSIAKLYGDKFHKNVHVSRNIPPTHSPDVLKTRVELGLPMDKRIVILQGAGINIQRGAEEAVAAMQYLDGFILLVVGGGDVLPVLSQLVSRLELHDKVIFKPKMSFEELRQYTMNSDLGLSIDKDTNLNYHFSLPNKLFDYIHSGIPVLSSGLIELKQIIEKYDIGYFIDSHEPNHIANVIRSIFADTERYSTVKANTLLARRELCWENEEKVLINVVESI